MRCRAAATLAVLFAATGDSASTHAAPRVDCVAVEVERFRLTVRDNVDLYIEPHGVERFGDGFLVAGMPTYEWTMDRSGRATLSGSRRILAAMVRGDSVRTIPSPPGVGEIGAVRSVALGDGAYGFVFSEVTSGRSDDPEVLRVLYGEYRAGEWQPLVTLGPIEGGSFDVARSSEIVRHADGGLDWAVMLFKNIGGIDGVIFQRRNGAWNRTTRSRRFADAIQLAGVGNEESTLIVGGLDPELRGLTSVRAILPDALMRRLEVGTPGVRYRWPATVQVGGELSVGWLREGPEGWSLWVATGVDASSEPGAEPLDSDVNWFAATPLPDGAALWVTAHPNPISQTEELRLYRDEGDGPVHIGTVSSPYTGLFNVAALESGDVLVIGPEVDVDSMYPFVRSLVIRLSISCNEPNAVDHTSRPSPSLSSWRHHASPSLDLRLVGDRLVPRRL